MKEAFSVICFILIFSVATFAQSEQEDISLVYSHQNYGGLLLHSQGWGAFFNFGKYKGYQNLTTFGFDIASLKHEKQIKAYPPANSFQNGGGYFYGKLNSVTLLRGHVGRRHFITQKKRANGVEVGYHWELGPTLALVKPIYLEVGYPSGDIRFSKIERYDIDFHGTSNIIGKASSLRGIGEISPVIGAHAKFAFLFEYANENDRVKGIETGIALDVFPKKLPMMAERIDNTEVNVNHAIFPTFFINLFIGKKTFKR